MRRALEFYKSRFPQIDAILIGTRRTDPHGGESLTSKGPRHECTPGQLFIYLVTLFFFCSHAFIPEYVRCRMAGVRAHQSHHRLVLF